MVYEVEFSEIVKKNLDAIEKTQAVRILKKIREITENPERYIKKLVESDLCSLRVGDYRVLLIIKYPTIFIVKIGHRSKVYEK